MTLTNIFAYTGIGQTPPPINARSVANAICESNQPHPYVPSDPDYMNAFRMQPASSLGEVECQLAEIGPKLQYFAEVENRILRAAFVSMPRTSVLQVPQLFSGQPLDSAQISRDHFAIEFLECPLKMAFTTAMASFLQTDSIITTKVVWSFSDSLDIAKHYQNRYLLTLHPPDNDSRIWEEASYITPLSDDPKKIEYAFSPGTSFVVKALEKGKIDGKPVHFITLKLRSTPFSTAGDEADTKPKPALIVL
jgi:hypothetical protein